MNKLTDLTLAQAKMAFGFFLLFAIFVLALAIALGHVHQESSYGLDLILGGMLTLSGGFANWAFGESRSSQAPNEEK